MEMKGRSGDDIAVNRNWTGYDKGSSSMIYKSGSLGKLAITGAAIFALFGMFAPILGSNISAHAATVLDSSFQLQVVPIASKLPADDGIYYAFIQLQNARDATPVIAPFDLDIRIISSDPSVLVGQEKVTLKEGQSMVKMELATTSKAGEASITAQAEGMKSASITFNTLRLDSLDPTKLALSAAPSILVPDPTISGVVYIQLLNSQNLPAASKDDLLVSLSSSRPQFGTVPSFVRLPPGTTGISVPFTPTDAIGTTTISASAPGLAPAQLDVKTDGPVATKLVVEFGPPKIPSTKAYKAIMSVQLRDAADNPVKATDPVVVKLRSSNTSVTKVPDTVRIEPGQSYATVTLLSEGSAGTTQITASAPSIESGISDLETIDLSSGTSEYFIELYQVPSKLPPDNAKHNAAIVQFVDSSGRPYNAPWFMYDKLVLSSSNPKVGIVGTSYERQYLFATVPLTTTYLTGSTSITASSTGFASAQKDFIVSGATPSALKLTQIPPIVQASNAKSQSLVLASLLDPSGKPTVAREDKILYLSSSSPAVASPQLSTIIPAGKSYAFVAIDTTTTPGSATISATSTDLSTGNLKMEIVGSKGTTSQSGLSLTTVPKIIANGQEYDAVFIQLQDLTGNNPVPAKSDIPISLSSSSPNAGRIQPDVTIPKGSSFAIAKFSTGRVEESVKITASSPGFKSVEASLETKLQPISITFVTNPLSQAEFDTSIPVEVQVKAGSFPLKGATIEIAGLFADPTYTTTDETGYAKGVYTANRPGANSIEAKVIMPGYKETSAKAGISLTQSVNLLVKATSEGGRDIPAQLKVQALKSAAKTYTTQASFKDGKWGAYTVTALDTKNNSGEFKFVSWSDGETQNPRTFDVIRDDAITAVYSAKFMLQVSSEYGNTWGTGYYKEGDRPTIGVDTTYVSAGLIDKTFAGWSGDILAEGSTSQVTMNGPKVITANWQDNYLKIIILVGGIGAAGFFLYTRMIKPRRVKMELAKAPDLDWYKT
jgi:hypothetical protein